MNQRHRRGLVLGVTALASAAAGWALRGEPPAATVNSIVAGAARVAAAPAQPPHDGKPVIVIASDGNATLHVDQQPLEWVLEQIAQQSGWSDVRERAARTASATSAAPAVPVAEAAVACADAPAPADAARVLQTIERGSDRERLDGLMQARDEQVTVPDGVLKSLYETDASDAVRLAAFETYLERHAGTAGAQRAALESALYVPSAAIQREARQRLDELEAAERADAALPQGSAP
jgi:hypothetical protein